MPVNAPAATATARVLHWQPLTLSLLGASLYLAVGSQEGIPLRFSIAGAAAAASTGFLIDDPAAVTVAASPTSLPVRRAHRIVLVSALIVTWWISAALFAAVRSQEVQLHDRVLEVTSLVAIALAASALASGVGDGTSGGIASAVATGGVYGATYLPFPSWVPFPSQAEMADSTQRWAVVLAAAVAMLAWSSRDPAGGGTATNPPLLQRTARDHR